MHLSRHSLQCKGAKMPLIHQTFRHRLKLWFRRAKNPVFMANYPGWGFHRFNPWRERFDVVIQNVLQAGLVDYWKQKTWIRMKEEQSTGDKDPGERDPMAPLGMDDLQVSGLHMFLRPPVSDNKF